MMSDSASIAQDKGGAGLALCEAAALATRTQALLDLLESRLGSFADDVGPVRRIGAPELDDLRAASDEIAELTAQIALALDDLPAGALAVDEQEIATAARAALADGIADDRRALTAAGLLTADQGLPALAHALVWADGHAHWTARVVDVLAAFRDVDEPCARELAARADVPAEARFCDLRSDCILLLAQTLRRHAAR
jgi:hypothetical protein